MYCQIVDVACDGTELDQDIVKGRYHENNIRIHRVSNVSWCHFKTSVSVSQYSLMRIPIMCTVGLGWVKELVGTSTSALIASNCA